MRRTSPARKRTVPWARRLVLVGTVVLIGAVALPPRGTRAAEGGRREAVGHSGAQVAAAGPVAAGLSLAAGFGTTAADLAGRAARAEAAAVQPGLLGALVPEALAGQLPPPTRADSGGEQEAQRSLIAPPAAGPAVLAGARERATATIERAAGVAELGAVMVEGALSASGGASEAEVSTGASRGESRIAELRLGAPDAGVVVLRGLRWAAHHAQGHPGEAAFEIASAEIAGRGVPVAQPGQVAAALAAAQAVLAPQGITLAVPAVAADTAGAAVGPLLVEVRDAPAQRSAGAAVYAPLAPAVSEATQRVDETAGPAAPQVSSALLVGSVVLSTLLGNGGVTVGLGGASAGATSREVPDLDFFSGLPGRPGGADIPASPPPPAAPSVSAPSVLVPAEPLDLPVPATPVSPPAVSFGGDGEVADRAEPPASSPAAGPSGMGAAGSAARRRAGAVTLALGAGLALTSLTVRRSRRRLLGLAAALRGVGRPARGSLRPAHGLVALTAAVAVLAAAAAPSRSPSTLAAGGLPSAVPMPAGGDEGDGVDSTMAGASAVPADAGTAPAGGGVVSGGSSAVAGGRRPVAGTGPVRSSSTAAGAPRSSGGPQPAGAPSAAARSGVTRAADCPGGDRQDRNSPYSPPCLHFTGDNGGATSKGVSGDRIVVAMRKIDDRGGRGRQYGITDTAADFERTLRAYVDYFNRVYQLYGRQVEVVFYEPKSGGSDAFRGGDQEEANADALVVGQQIKAFADVSANYPALADALARQGVVAIGPIHMPADWYQARAPFAWGLLPDCTSLLANHVDYLVQRVAPYPARFAGNPALRAKPRALGVVVPDSPWYQQCANQAEARLKAAGHRLAARVNYPLDFNQAAQTATNVVSQLKAAGVTTVLCWCDPVLPYFATTQATQQDYGPEWVISGFALTDSDLAGQLYDRQQWAHAFGVSLLGALTQGYDSESYRAYKALRADEPAALRDILYYPLLQLFACLQMAGPNLTPQTFEQGCFTAPWGAAEMGRWRYGPGDYTAMEDGREVYWDPDATSPFNGKPGRYVSTLDGRRFRGDWPAGEPPFPPPR